MHALILAVGLLGQIPLGPSDNPFLQEPPLHLATPYTPIDGSEPTTLGYVPPLALPGVPFSLTYHGGNGGCIYCHNWLVDLWSDFWQYWPMCPPFKRVPVPANTPGTLPPMPPPPKTPIPPRNIPVYIPPIATPVEGGPTQYPTPPIVPPIIPNYPPLPPEIVPALRPGITTVVE